MRDVGERGRHVEQEVEDDEVVSVLRLVLELRALHPGPRPHEALAARVDRVVRVGPPQVEDSPRQLARRAAASAPAGFATPETKILNIFCCVTRFTDSLDTSIFI